MIYGLLDFIAIEYGRRNVGKTTVLAGYLDGIDKDIGCLPLGYHKKEE